MDLAPVCRIANEYIRAAKVTAQVDTLARDMFRETWPLGYDTVFFSNIFHDWSPEVCADLAAKSLQILRQAAISDCTRCSWREQARIPERRRRSLR